MFKTENYTSPVRRLIKLYIESGRLLFAEKLTVILAGMAIGFIAIFFVVLAVFFISLALASLLGDVMQPVWAYLIVAGAYVLIVGAFILLRRQLIINPIARFISRSILSPEQPVKPKNDEQN